MVDDPVALMMAAAGGGTLSAGVTAAIVKFMLPRWIEQREEFEERITQKFEETKGQADREHALIREQIAAIQRYVDVENAKLRELWHAQANSTNVAVGKAASLSEQNTAAVVDIRGEVTKMRDAVHEIDKNCAAIIGTVSGLKSAVEALTLAVRRDA